MLIVVLLVGVVYLLQGMRGDVRAVMGRKEWLFDGADCAMWKYCGDTNPLLVPAIRIVGGGCIAENVRFLDVRRGVGARD